MELRIPITDLAVLLGKDAGGLAVSGQRRTNHLALAPDRDSIGQEAVKADKLLAQLLVGGRQEVRGRAAGPQGRSAGGRGRTCQGLGHPQNGVGNGSLGN